MPLIQGFSIDTIVNLAKATALHPLALLVFLGYKAREANGWPVRDGLVTAAYAFLGIYATSWFSNRWRNGLIPQARLNSKTWPKEIVLVTGGAQGIAKSLCDKLAAKGANVAALDIIDFQSSHPNIKAYKCDISSYDDLKRVRGQIEKDFGGHVTMVANVAGLNNKSLILDLTPERVSRMIDVNLKSREL